MNGWPARENKGKRGRVWSPETREIAFRANRGKWIKRRQGGCIVWMDGNGTENGQRLNNREGTASSRVCNAYIGWRELEFSVFSVFFFSGKLDTNSSSRNRKKLNEGRRIDHFVIISVFARNKLSIAHSMRLFRRGTRLRQFTRESFSNQRAFIPDGDTFDPLGSRPEKFQGRRKGITPLWIPSVNFNRYLISRGGKRLFLKKDPLFHFLPAVLPTFIGRIDTINSDW